MAKEINFVIYGEVLFDCFPDGSRVLGGAPFNVAWHCQAFGLAPLFVSRIGKDEAGQEIISAMQGWGMNVDGVQIDSEHKTGIVDVSFNNGEPAYDIVENSAWDFIDDQYLPDSQNQAVLYHGSLALRNTVSEKSLYKLIQDNSGPVFVDVNLRPPWWDVDKVHSIITHAKWVKLNNDELSLLVPDENDPIAKARHIIQRYQPELVVVTQGEEGALAVTESETFSVKPDFETTVVDTVGAGDAFASILMLGLYKEWPLATILERAQQFASKIVGLRGATTEDKEFYQPFIQDWQL